MLRRQGQQAVCRAMGRRAIHSTGAVWAFKKKSSDGANASVFKRGTPKSKGNWIDDFINTASYGKFTKKALEPQADGPGSSFFDIEQLEPGKVFRYPTHAEESLRIFGSYRRGQKHELFKNHTTLIRDGSSLHMADAVKNGLSSSSKDNRFCLMGGKGTGKSTLLAQTQAFALQRGYVVLPVPRAAELVSGDNDAFYNDALNMFIQPMYVRRWMKRVAKGNERVLRELPAPDRLAGGKKGSTATATGGATKSLYDVLLEGRKRPDACHVMEQVVGELAAQETAPVLFTLDDVNVLSQNVYSENTDHENQRIYHGDLQVPKTFLDFLSGARTFKRGMVVTALNSSHRVNETILAGLGLQEPTPYAKIDRYDPLLASKFTGVTPLTLQHYTQAETRTMLEYWNSVGVVPSELDERLLNQKYFISGNGNPEALLLACTENY
ncbi:hypothetical protein TRICI_000698 [Trichomonascus ciferrii]|uniref:Small ribosomal subunit protein mS29 n=1 Tax=Trichomonascus ciferrii TaxID=44093 RepID=A0A642VAL1_9ASCO|nr:hypothetical protein TRICI_000698 [Trichomonascus ciferrii]